MSWILKAAGACKLSYLGPIRVLQINVNGLTKESDRTKSMTQGALVNACQQHQKLKAENRENFYLKFGPRTRLQKL